MQYLWICVCLFTVVYSKIHVKHTHLVQHQRIKTVSAKSKYHINEKLPNLNLKQNYVVVSNVTAGEKKNKAGAIKTIASLFKKSFKAVRGIGKSMKKAGKLKKFDTAKLDKVDGEIAEESNKLVDYSQRALAAVESATTGLVTLVKGIKANEWLEMVSGGLAMVAAIAAFAGPIGVAISLVLTVASVILGLIGGALGGEESTEIITKRLLENALMEQREDDLRDGANGLKKVYSLLAKSIAHLREAETVSKGQAVEFYNQAFVGIKYFGILEFYINKWCSVGNFTDDTKKKEVNDKADRCLEFVNLYCDLAILRQLLIADMACLMEEKGLKVTSRNLLRMVAAEQIADMEFLKFVFDPINNRDHRYVTARYVSSKEKFTTLSNYLKKLDEISITTYEESDHKRSSIAPRKLLKDIVLYCTGKYLQDDCFQNKDLGVYNLHSRQFRDWPDKIKSIYISENVNAILYNTKENVEPTLEIFGPIVYNVHDVNFKIKGIYTFESSTHNRYTEDDPKERVKVCEKENMDMDGLCDSVGSKQIGEANSEVVFKNPVQKSEDDECIFPFEYDGIMRYGCLPYEGKYWCYPADGGKWQYCEGELEEIGVQQQKNWYKRIVSISIPPFVKITGFDATTTSYGPYYGPSVINKLSSEKTWVKVKVEKTYMQTSMMVKICSEQHLNGFCDHVKLPKIIFNAADEVEELPTKIVSLEKYQGTIWTTKSLKLKSMKLPGGVKVTLRSSSEKLFGPYIGPATIAKIDGISDIIYFMNFSILY